jgi:hypothetical protein
LKCISIPECTQRLSHLTTSGGQHGQESEEGEEGEERSEEDCEEDPQGREEEEVTSPDLIAGGFRCRHVIGATRVEQVLIRTAPSDAKRVSARHQVKRLDRTLQRRLRRSKPVRQKKRVFFTNKFSSFGADRLKSAISSGTASPGWDLVLTCSPTPSLQPEQAAHGRSVPNFQQFLPRPSNAALCLRGYVALRRWLAVCNSCTVNRSLAPRQTIREHQLFRFGAGARAAAIYAAFIAPLKLPFKFDRS